MENWKTLLLYKYKVPKIMIMDIEDYIHNQNIKNVKVIPGWIYGYTIRMTHQDGRKKKWKPLHRNLDG